MKIYFLILSTLLSFVFYTLNAQQINFEKTYGLPGYNYGEKAIQTNDEGYIILGNKSGFTGSSDIYLIKTDTVGKIIWDKAIGDSNIEWAEDIIPTFDNGFVISGYSNNGTNNDYQVLLIKLDSTGNVKWNKSFGGNDWDFAYSLVQTPDSGFIIIGETYSYGNGNNDVFILKTDKNGTQEWQKTYGGSNEDVAKSINPYKNGFVIGGYTNSFGAGQYDCYLLYIDQFGDTLWTRTFGDSLDDKCFCAKQVENYRIILTGSTQNYGAKQIDPIIYKIDSAANKLWHNLHGGTDDDEYFDFIVNHKNQYVFAGYTKSFGYALEDFYSIATDNGGYGIFGSTFGKDKTDIAYSINQTKDKGYILAGTSTSLGIGISNIYVIKADSILQFTPGNHSHELGIITKSKNNKNFVKIYPNPSDKLINIEICLKTPANIKIYISDILGQEIYYKKIENNPIGNTITTIDLSKFNNGIYFTKLLINNTKYSQKIVLTK